MSDKLLPTSPHFADTEFRGQKALLDPQLLESLFSYRAAIGTRILISPTPGAMVRFVTDPKAKGYNSQHNVERLGLSCAIDVTFPDVSLLIAYDRALNCGLFSGIGFYPDWYPYPGLHLDCRHDRTPNNPALWGGIREVRDDGTLGGQYIVSARTAIDTYRARISAGNRRV